MVKNLSIFLVFDQMYCLFLARCTACLKGVKPTCFNFAQGLMLNHSGLGSIWIPTLLYMIKNINIPDLYDVYKQT